MSRRGEVFQASRVFGGVGAILRAIEPFRRKFHVLYEKGKRDGTIRTDEPEETMFNATMHIMFAVCCRYAQGLVYGGEDQEDLTQELMILKRMIMSSYEKT